MGGVAFDPWLDDDTAERLLAGLIAPEDAPPGYAPVARLIRAVAAPPGANELFGEPDAIAVASALLRSRRSSAERTEPRSTGSTRRRSGGGIAKAKVAALAVVGTLVTTTGLAAAGALPEPVRDLADQVLSTVGITLLDPSGKGATGGGDDAGSANAGRAGGHLTRRGHRVAAIARTTDAEGVEKGARISEEASGGKSEAGEHGKADGDGRGEGRRVDHGNTQDKGQKSEHDNAQGKDQAGERGGRSESAEHGRPTAGSSGGGRSGGGP